MRVNDVWEAGGIETLPYPLCFWAKKNVEPDVYYPLLYHMLDVVAVTHKLWDNSLHSAARAFITKNLGIPEAEARGLVSFWCGLHDIGKASPGFQRKGGAIWQTLLQLGFSGESNDPGHGIITALTLQELLHETTDNELARNIATTVGGHHGVFPRSSKILNARILGGNRQWHEARRQLFKMMINLSGPCTTTTLTTQPSPPFYMFLAGLTSVADWIASNDVYFPYEESKHGIEGHLADAHHKAQRALYELGWTGWQPATELVQIQKLFPDIIKSIRPLQAEVVELAQQLKKQPGLVIIEAPMGEGKTEAAIYLADAWAAGLGQKGCYFALPTMATSEQMFGRVLSYLKNRYPNDRVNLMLLHGHASLSAEFDSLKAKGLPFNVEEISPRTWG